MNCAFKYVKNVLKGKVRRIFNAIGFDVVRVKHFPRHSFLGLKNQPIRTIIDVGANIGQFAKMVESIFPQANIYCFEPLPPAFEQLNKWAMGKKGKVKAIKAALGDYEGKIGLLHHSIHAPSTSVLRTTELCEEIYPYTKEQCCITVKQTTLDKAVRDLNIDLNPQVLIKMDVQGYEDRVINGGKNVFLQARACIVEINLVELYEKQTNFHDIIVLLYNLGYYYAGNLNQSFDRDGCVVFVDAIFERRNYG